MYFRRKESLYGSISEYTEKYSFFDIIASATVKKKYINERINKIYDDLSEHVEIEISREEHETVMLSLAYGIRELKERERSFIINPAKYALANRLYRQICLLFDSCEEKYEIYIQKPSTLFMTNVFIVILVESLEVSNENQKMLEDIISHTDRFSVRPGSDDRVRMSFEIDDVYIEIGENGEPVLSMTDD